MKAAQNKPGKKMIVVLALCSILLIAIELLIARSVNADFSQLMQDQRKNSVSKMAHLAHNSIKPILDEVHTSALDSDAARGKIMDLVRNMTYEDEYGDNYIFMSAYDGTMLVQPFEPQKEGSDQWDLLDTYGKYIIRDLIRAAKEKPEGSFVAYHYYLPKEDRIEEKLSYVIGIPEVEAYIGTGMYIESSYKDLQRVLGFQRFSMMLISLLILGLASVYISAMYRTNRELSREIRERRKHEEEIRYLAYYDNLTALHNRVFIMNELKQELEKCTVRENKGSILFVDLDNFKKVNDNFGHFFGDEVLMILADRLKSINSERFLPARIGGDEFVILCYGADITETIRMAEQVLTVFRNPIALHDTIINLTCSMGIALYPKDGRTVEDIFKNADMALYSAKYQGKDNYIFYKDSMSAELQYKSEMEEQLRLAYHNKELVLYYQPIYDIEQQKITGHEALIRWISPRYGMVMPSQIIPLAEEIGLIDKIGSWVIDSAFAYAKKVEDRGCYISCNVSSAQLSRSNFVENVLERFEYYQLGEGSVALEITESCLIESFESVSRKLTRLREKGIMIYLDDFGTGYSSLNYLKNLPADYIKIDKSFIDKIAYSGPDSKILKTIIILAHEIGIKTVAEGVETDAQYQYLEECQCDMIQGYFIGRPKPVE